MKAKALRELLDEPWSAEQIVLLRRAWCVTSTIDRNVRSLDWSSWKIPFIELSHGYSTVSSSSLVLSFSLLNTFLLQRELTFPRDLEDDTISKANDLVDDPVESDAPSSRKVSTTSRGKRRVVPSSPPIQFVEESDVGPPDEIEVDELSGDDEAPRETIPSKVRLSFHLVVLNVTHALYYSGSEVTLSAGLSSFPSITTSGPRMPRTIIPRRAPASRYLSIKSPPAAR